MFNLKTQQQGAYQNGVVFFQNEKPGNLPGFNYHINKLA